VHRARQLASPRRIRTLITVTAYRNDLEAAQARVRDLEREHAVLHERNLELQACARTAPAARRHGRSLIRGTPLAIYAALAVFYAVLAPDAWFEPLAVVTAAVCTWLTSVCERRNRSAHEHS
jgi:hypothetical protein